MTFPFAQMMLSGIAQSADQREGPHYHVCTFYGKECVMINPCLGKEVTEKNICGEQSNYDPLKKELQNLKCEYYPRWISCHRSPRVKHRSDVLSG